MSKLIVKKFGGTSVANAERIEAVADLVAKSVEEGNEVAVVLSAMGKSTDELIKLSKEINPNPDLREYDALVSTGEQISVALLAMALQKRNIKGKSYTAYQLGIRTNAMHGRARILDVKVERIKEEIKNEKNNIIAFDTGYIKSKTAILDANITTLIAAIILFFMGSGPIKGFSVTLVVGIFTTLFSVYFIARMLTALYVVKNKDKEKLI